MAEAPPFVVLGSYRGPESQAHPYGARYWTRAVDGHAVYFPTADASLGDEHLPAIRAAIAGVNRWATPAEDPIVAGVCADLQARSGVGLAKYGTTLARTDLPPAAWRRHMYEELLDAALYLKRQDQPHTVAEALRAARDALLRAAQVLDAAGTAPAGYAADLRGTAGVIAHDWLPTLEQEPPA